MLKQIKISTTKFNTLVVSSLDKETNFQEKRR